MSEKLEKHCEPCKEGGESEVAVVYCPECPEYLCEVCKNAHKKQKATKAHDLVSLIDNKSTCEPCEEEGISSVANLFCKQCDEKFCDDCGKHHNRQKTTKSHKLVEINNVTALGSTSTHDSVKRPKSPGKFQTQSAKSLDVPGKPYALNIKADSISLQWDKAEQFGPGDYYQIRYKIVDGKASRWKFHPSEPESPFVILSDVNAATKYIFQVRVVHDMGEGPYSPQSDTIATHESPAARLVRFSVCRQPSRKPPIYVLPITEVRNSRNPAAKSKKFEIGDPRHGSTRKERTIMLVGATGSGKSTLVDGMVNYVLGVNWTDPFRFTTIHLEKEEMDKKGNQAVSQTEWITCYTVNNEQSSRLGYKLTIIDTPGFGDTRGLERDGQLVDQIRKLFSDRGERGVVSLDAVCFLAKAPDARLTATQNYIFHSIMSLFGKDIEENICTLITFADGKEPPVLHALKKSNLPFGKHFTFNNSSLFEPNTGLDKSSLAPMFWDMGVQSFRNFFTTIDTMREKSMLLTKQVLEEREKLEVTVESLQVKISAGLAKIEQLKQQTRIIEQHKVDKRANQNFVIETERPVVTEHALPKGIHVTNCLQCNTTCHDNCVYENDEDKKKCSAMGSNGYCTICDNKCYWNQHRNSPYIFRLEKVTEKQTVQEMYEKYSQAGRKVDSLEKLINCLSSELVNLEDTIAQLFIIVRDCNNRLKEIALRPNPLNMVGHLDIMIAAEKREEKEGYIERIKILEEYRKKAEIGKYFERFQKEMDNVSGLPRRPEKKGFWRTLFSI